MHKRIENEMEISKSLLFLLVYWQHSLFSQFEMFHPFLLHLEVLLFGHFCRNAFCVNFHFLLLASFILSILSETLSPIEIGLIAGLGAVLEI
jgi:hypothetical protein